MTTMNNMRLLDDALFYAETHNLKVKRIVNEDPWDDSTEYPQKGFYQILDNNNDVIQNFKIDTFYIKMLD